jgi:hypothetical protein
MLEVKDYDNDWREPLSWGREDLEQGRAEQISVSGNTEQGDEEHEVNKEKGRKSNLEVNDHSEANLEVAFSNPSLLRHHDIDAILKSGNSSSQL